ncbi:MAG: hypothetical protein NVS3B21_20350 [Acidimicrobiales bacterium]
MTARTTGETPSGSPPVWSTPLEALQVVVHPAHLRKTLLIAVVVGTVLFMINQLDVVLQGRATAIVWIKIALTYVVPFCVSNVGILIASRAP